MHHFNSNLHSAPQRAQYRPRQGRGLGQRAVKRDGKGAISGAKDADMRALEKRLSDALGLDVSIDRRGKGGTLHIKYKDLDQLDTVLKKLNR